MSILKSLIIALILTSFVVTVFAVDANTANQVCKLSKKDLGDGKQNPDGQCVQVFMGEVPDINNMLSTVIIFPKNNEVLDENQAFTIRTKTTNLVTGFFDDPASQYYIFAQTLADNGQIQGHSHVTVQKLGDDENETPDPRIFAFFKGLNDPADGKGELTAAVDKGLPAGKYRLCTMVSSFAHQPTLMPVAQRGSQDDCVRFTVKGNGNNKKRFPRFSRRF